MVSGVVEDNRAKTDSHIDRNKTFLTFVKTRPCLSPRRMEVCFGRAENALRSISERLQQILVLLFHLAQKVLVLPLGTTWAFEIFFKTWFLIGSGSNRIKDNSSSTIGTSWMIPDGVYRQWDSGSRDLWWRKLVWMKCNAWNNMQLVITCLLVILVATHDNSLLQAMYMQLVLAVQHMK